ncbi:dopamine beta-hydroxylase-like [Gigantopelta aegis]|uniref:dopamine beta-hydroxylase-like n=1 Tax=Gigantopelta aegis TaxID=1735272 RepID=UPI001B888382|nr:dopamine beta-hydroxylase-like [Gigantopelta aegis]
MSVWILWLFIVITQQATDVTKTCDLSHIADVQSFDVRLPVMTVPSDTTTYVCQQFQVPDDNVYHAVAFEPVIDNSDVMHHMLLFGCESYIGDMSPHRCGVTDQRCASWLAQWTLGLKGDVCAYRQTGIRFGKNSFRFFALQIHWNNANHIQNSTDSSGMRIFYTKRLRQFDAGNVQIGQNDLEIPPGSAHHSEVGGCSGRCTKKLLPHPIYLTRTYIHMHYLGSSGKLELYRHGRLVSDVATDAPYVYSQSPIHNHQPPVLVLPGDELRLTCVFDTKTGDKYRTKPVYFGEGSNAEMCYAFVTYYPRVQYFDQCIQFAEYDICHSGGRYGNCSFGEFNSLARKSFIPNVTKFCSTKTERTQTTCTPECAQAIKTFKSHACMQGRLGTYAQRVVLSTIQRWPSVKNVMFSNNTDCYMR